MAVYVWIVGDFMYGFMVPRFIGLMAQSQSLASRHTLASDVIVGGIQVMIVCPKQMDIDERGVVDQWDDPMFATDGGLGQRGVSLKLDRFGSVRGNVVINAWNLAHEDVGFQLFVLMLDVLRPVMVIIFHEYDVVMFGGSDGDFQRTGHIVFGS